MNKVLIGLTIILTLYVDLAEADNTSEVMEFEQAMDVGM